MNRAIGAVVVLCVLVGGSRARGQASLTPLGDLPGGGFESRAFGVSSDGSTVVGYSRTSPTRVEAFRWTRTAGMVGIDDLPGGGSESGASGVSADGSVVVGGGSSASGN